MSQPPAFPNPSYQGGQGYPPHEKGAVHQQPQPHQGMHPGAGGGNRNAKNLPQGPGGREWSHGLCDCFEDTGTCLLSWCLPCLAYGAIKKRYDHLTTQGVPDPHHGSGGYFGVDCCMYGCLASCGFHWVLEMGLRSSVRQRYNISGGTCGDCLIATCCPPCDLTQQSLELELEEGSFGHR